MLKFYEGERIWIEEFESEGEILEMFEDESGFSNSYAVLIESEGVERMFFEHELDLL